MTILFSLILLRASIKEDSSGSLVSSMDKLARESHADLRAKRQKAFNLAANNASGTPRLGMVWSSISTYHYLTF